MKSKVHSSLEVFLLVAVSIAVVAFLLLVPQPVFSEGEGTGDGGLGEGLTPGYQDGGTTDQATAESIAGDINARGDLCDGCSASVVGNEDDGFAVSVSGPEDNTGGGDNSGDDPWTPPEDDPISPPLPVPPDAPSVNAVCTVNTASTNNQIEASWNNVSGAIRYELVVSNSSGVVYQNTNYTNRTYTLINAVQGDTYTFAVRAGNDAGQSGEVSASAVCPVIVEEPPKNPITCGSGGNSVTFSWGAAFGADQYAVRLAPEGGGANSEIIGDGASDTGYTTGRSKTTNLINPGVQYEWWVHGIDSESGTWSTNTRQSFSCLTTGPAEQPPQPTMLPVECSADNTQVTLRWGTVSQATSYPVRIRQVGVPSSERATPWNEPTGTSYTWPINPGTEYEWWVHAYDQSQVVVENRWSPFTRVSFTCPASSGPTSSSLNGSQMCVNDGQDVFLSWNNVTGANTYTINVEGPSGVQQINANSNTSQYVDIQPDTSYRWWVEAFSN